jgi:magnesium transporter
LTKLHENPSLLNDLWSFDSEEAEVLVENYLQDIVSIRTKASLLQHRIQNTESLVMLKLDSIRNYLLGVDLMFSLTAVCVALGTFITGIFGMNLNSGLEEAGGVFWGLVISTGILLSILVIGGLFFFQTKGIFLF